MAPIKKAQIIQQKHERLDEIRVKSSFDGGSTVELTEHMKSSDKADEANTHN